MQIKIRQAKSTDAVALKMLNDQFNGENSNTTESITASLKNNNREIVCVAEADGTLVGFCCGQIQTSMCYDYEYAVITEFFVTENHRRQGIGKQLLTATEKALNKKGITHFHLSTEGENTAALALYHACGYTKTSVMLEKTTLSPEIAAEINHYTALSFTFTDFITVPPLSDGEIYLVCTEKYTNPEKQHVPAYHFMVCKNGEKIGHVGLRMGYGGGPFGQNLYYGGQIGYAIDEAHRGNGYAVRACRLLIPVAKAHDMHTLLITNDKNNKASQRVCEKLGAKYIRTVETPIWHDLYKDGQRFCNIYEWKI